MIHSDKTAGKSLPLISSYPLMNGTLVVMGNNLPSKDSSTIHSLLSSVRSSLNRLQSGFISHRSNESGALQYLESTTFI